MIFKRSLALILVLVLSLILVACSEKGVDDNSGTTIVTESENTDTEDTISKEVRKVELLVSAAASLTDVMEEIEASYQESNPNTEIIFTFAGSGALQAQIEEGAPVDVFISAAEKQMDALEEKDLILKDTRKTLLVNKVVLITPKDSELGISEFKDILNSGIDKIAIGDPSSVPVGQYSEEIFNNLYMMDSLQPKLILANDVRTVLNWVEIGEVDCTYPAAVIASSKEVEESQDFVDFLSTDKAKKIFEKYGFSMK